VNPIWSTYVPKIPSFSTVGVCILLRVIKPQDKTLVPSFCSIDLYKTICHCLYYKRDWISSENCLVLPDTIQRKPYNRYRQACLEETILYRNPQKVFMWCEPNKGQSDTGRRSAALRRPSLKVKVTLRLTVNQSVCLGVKPKSWTFDQNFFYSPLKVTVLSFWGAISDERSGLSCVSLCHWSLP
jgi:hypothetical protein